MTLISTNPATGETIWQGDMTPISDLDAVVNRSRAAFAKWAATPLADRIALVRSWGKELESARDDLAKLIMHETGKAAWDAASEVAAMVGKTELSIKAHAERTGATEKDLGANQLVISHRPHGVMVVLGPYNFPGHLPNGHIVPALLAGNSVIFKPSEQTPATAAFVADLWHKAGMPADLIQIVQGCREQAEYLVSHDDTDGILFTGGETAGRAIHRALAGRPDKMLALELGGNAPLVVWDPRDVAEAADMVVKSAFTSSGQRCTCARRLIVPTGAAGDEILTAVLEAAKTLVVGLPDADGSFMGSLISTDAAGAVLKAQDDLIDAGGEALMASDRAPEGDAFLTPGIIDVTGIADKPDEEVFGPLLQVTRVDSFEDAIAEANNTRFGLAAGLISRDRALFDRFVSQIRAGIVNFNCITVGASGAAPFGGVGASGNHRPAGYMAADYCAWPVASLINE